MRSMTLAILAILFVCGSCYADSIKGKIEKVEIKSYEMVVNGNLINISKAMVFTENDLKVTKSVIIRDVKDHVGEVAICYGSVGKDNVFRAYKVRIMEGHK